MSDTYAGDSWGKKLARLCMWETVAATLGDAFRTAPIVYLASREAADFRALRALGARGMIGVERERAAYELARASYPEAAIEFGDVVDAVRRRPDAAAVCLDFCGQLCQETADTVSDVVSYLAPGALVVVALLKGRDGVNIPLSLPEGLNRRHRRVYAKSLRRMRIPIAWAADDAAEWRSASTDRHDRDDRQAGYDRADALEAFINRAACVRHRTTSSGRRDNDWHCHGSFPYHSGASPMVYLFGEVCPFGGKPTRSPPYYNKKFTNAIDAVRADALDQRWDASTSSEVADSYNLDEGTVRAWRAHKTMGTYDDDRAAE